MTTREPLLSETELDSALDCLMAPAPSDIVVRRVEAMAPPPPAAFHRRYRAAIAAVLVLAVAGAITVEVMLSANHPLGQNFGPAGDIATQDLNLVDPLVPSTRTDRVSVASLPLE